MCPRPATTACTLSCSLSHYTSCRIQNTLHELQLLRAKSHSAADTTDSSTDEVSVSLQGARCWLCHGAPVSSPNTSRAWCHHLILPGCPS